MSQLQQPWDGSGFFVDDGCSYAGYIEAVDGLHPALRFTYRGITYHERQALINESVQSAASTRSERAGQKVWLVDLEKRLISWSIPGVKPTRDRLDRLHPSLYQKLTDIVYGFAPTALDPEWTEAAKLAAERTAAESSIAIAPESVELGN